MAKGADIQLREHVQVGDSAFDVVHPSPPVGIRSMKKFICCQPHRGCKDLGLEPLLGRSSKSNL